MQLTIPAQDSDSRDIRLKPREVREWLNNLPYMNVARTLKLANQQLRVLNRQVVTPSARLQILDDFLATYQRLETSDSAGGLTDEAEQAALKHLSQNIGFGYKILVHTLVNGRGKLLDARLLPQAMLGAIHLLGRQMIHAYRSYQRAPRAVWSESLAIYQHARAIRRENHAAQLAGQLVLSIDAAFRLMALLRLADPYQLRPGMLAALQHYFSTHITLTAIASEADLSASNYILRLTDKGQRARVDDTDAIGIDIRALLKQMQADIKRLKLQRPAQGSSLSHGTTAATLLGALQQTTQLWETRRERKSVREKTDAGLELVVGLEAAWCMVNRGRVFDPALYIGNDPAETIDIGAGHTAETAVRPQPAVPMQCSSIDRNAGGLGMRYRGGARIPLVGQLLAVRRNAQQAGGWVLGAFRWLVEAESSSGFDAGVQYLAGEPQALVVRPLDGSGFGGEYQPALGATQKRGEQRVLTLVVRAKQLQAGDEFNLYNPNGEQQRGRCIELLESGLGFDRLIYQLQS